MTEVLKPSQWLANARRHATAANLLDGQAPELAAEVGFHAQQCAECALKAVLMWREADVPRTHDLQDLLSLIRSVGVLAPPELLELGALTSFAVELRYADLEAVSAERAHHAVRLAAEALQWAQSLIGG